MPRRAAIPLVPKQVDAFAPRSQKYDVPDAVCPGIHLRVSPSGSKCWRFFYRDAAGRLRRMTIGHWPVMSLKDAREDAFEKRRALECDGVEPIEAKLAARAQAQAHAESTVAVGDDSSGRSEVYVVSFPDLKNRRQISAEGGTFPRWDHRGTALYYLQQGYLVAHEIAGGDQLSRGRANRLFPTTALQFDVLPNSRFILTESNTAPADAPLHVIVNWFDELRAAMPR
jgi:hypothetical protein